MEVKGHVYGEISGQKYKFPVFTRKIEHAHTVCTTVPGLLPSLKGPGYKVNSLDHSASLVIISVRKAVR